MRSTTLALCVATTATALYDHDAARQALIDATNSQPGVKWTAAMPERFKGQPIGASKALCGVKPGHKEMLAKMVAEGTIGLVKKDPEAGVSIPDHFDSEANWPHCAKVIGDIRDQSACGCCWAFGAASAASDRVCISTNASVVVPLSAQDMCFCGESDGCDGGFPASAWGYIKDTGLVTGGQNKGLGPFNGTKFCSDFSLPHCHHHGPKGNDPYPAEGQPGCPNVQSSPQCPTQCDAGAQAPHDKFEADKYRFSGYVQTFESDADTIAAAIMKNGPVEAAFTVYSDFENYAGGIYHATSSQSMGGHAIRIVGWGVEDGTKYWKVANSWNPYWGEKGYFRIVRGTNECGIEESVVASDPDAIWNGPGIVNQPTPAPGPAKPGKCSDQQDKTSCQETEQGGEVCTWCVLSALGIAFCQLGSDGCGR